MTRKYPTFISTDFFPRSTLSSTEKTTSSARLVTLTFITNRIRTSTDKEAGREEEKEIKEGNTYDVRKKKKNLTTERAADVDSNITHASLVRVADAVVERQEDAAGGKQQTQGQKDHRQKVQGWRGTSCIHQLFKSCTNINTNG